MLIVIFDMNVLNFLGKMEIGGLEYVNFRYFVF